MSVLNDKVEVKEIKIESNLFEDRFYYIKIYS